jgi:hypothetical protein
MCRRFTPAAAACAPLAALLRDPGAPWDLRLMALLLWATAGGPPEMRAPLVPPTAAAAAAAAAGSCGVQRLWCAGPPSSPAEREAELPVREWEGVV